VRGLAPGEVNVAGRVQGDRPEPAGRAAVERGSPSHVAGLYDRDFRAVPILAADQSDRTDDESRAACPRDEARLESLEIEPQHRGVGDRPDDALGGDRAFLTDHARRDRHGLTDEQSRVRHRQIDMWANIEKARVAASP
jgi:hypothetical protein